MIEVQAVHARDRMRRPRTVGTALIVSRLVAACVLSIAVAACRSSAAESGWWARHTRGDMWSAGVDRFSSEPSQWVAPAVLLAATPLVWIADKDISEDSISHAVFNTSTSTGDALATGLTLGPLVLGSIEAWGGDARFLEASAESMTATLAITYGLKSVVNRQRPDGSSEDSFPSGHTSAAFAGATLFQRAIDRAYDEPWWSWLVYLPASYVGVSRLEGDRHYLADVLFGAALGMSVSHIVLDAHEFGLGRHGVARVMPCIAPDGPALCLQISF